MHPVAPAVPPTNALNCQACGRDCDRGICCTGCGALAFCSQQHRSQYCIAAASGSHTPVDCARMSAQMSRRQLLLPDPPIAPPWCSKNPAQLCRLLAALGNIHDAPAWCSACPVHGSSSSSSSRGSSSSVSPVLSSSSSSNPNAAAQADWEAAWQLSPETGGAPAWCHRGTDAANCIVDWSTYYAHAGLSHASPAALVVHHALTLWHCLVHVLPERGRPLPSPEAGPLHVHYLGGWMNVRTV